MASANLSAQYTKIKDNSGYTDNEMARLNAAADGLVSILPTSFKTQFKVFGSGYYLHVPATNGGVAPMAQSILTEVGQSSPYYLLFAKETTPGGLYIKINVHLKLPNDQVWGCLDDQKRAFIAEEVQSVVNETYTAKGGRPNVAADAEIAGIEKLKRYIEKAIECCYNRSPATCTLCPDSDVASRVKHYFEDSICSIKIPVVISQGVTVVMDKPTPTNKPAEKENALAGGIQSKTDLRIAFGPGEPGVLATVMGSVFASDLFTGVSTQGFITANENLCKPDFKLKTIRAQHEDPAAQASIWAHIWSDPDDPGAQAYLYVAARTIGKESLCAANTPDILKALEESYTADNHTYASKFAQSASVLFFHAVATCAEVSSNETDFAPDFNSASYLTEICSGGGSLLESSYFLSPACQPIKLPKGTIPSFSASVASDWGYDKRGIYGFFDVQGYWKGCGIRGGQFVGFYRTVQNLQRYPANAAATSAPMTVQLGTVGPDGYAQLNAYTYTPPASRMPSAHANGAFVPVFDGLSNSQGTTLYQYHTKTLPQLKAISDGTFNVLWDTEAKGTIIKWGSGATRKYYLIKYNGNTQNNDYFEFDCGAGGWAQISSNPLASTQNLLFHPQFGFLLIESGVLNTLINTGYLTKHGILDLAGCIPIIGEVADVANFVLYCAEGDSQGAILASIALIPLVGDLAKGGKALLKSGAAGLNIPITPSKSIQNAETGVITFFKRCQTKPGTKTSAESSTFPCFEKVVRVELDPISQSAIKHHATDLEYTELLNEIQANSFALGEAIMQDLSRDVTGAWLAFRRGGLPTTPADIPKLKMLADDLKNGNFAAALAGNAGLVRAWEVLYLGAYRTNINALEFYSDPLVLASRQHIIDLGISNSFPHIPIEELAAIHHYTTNAYIALNQALRSTSTPNSYFLGFEELLNNGLSKLSPYSGEKVHRGVYGEEANIARKWVAGQEIPFKDFKSSSKSAEIANNFSLDNHGDVVYEILNPAGYDICGISCYPELEVLFKSKSKFKVISIDDSYPVDYWGNIKLIRKIVMEYIP